MKYVCAPLTTKCRRRRERFHYWELWILNCRRTTRIFIDFVRRIACVTVEKRLMKWGHSFTQPCRTWCIYSYMSVKCIHSVQYFQPNSFYAVCCVRLFLSLVLAFVLEYKLRWARSRGMYVYLYKSVCNSTYYSEYILTVTWKKE